jgi:hypothetical protein
MTRIAWLVVLAAGCSKGEIQWSSGHAAMRTAWWQAAEVEGGEELTLALSTSDFPCSLEDLYSDVEAENSLAHLELQTSTCREGAQHVVIHMFRAGGDPLGQYAGQTFGDAQDLADEARFATASYYAVIEAGVLYVDGINRNYAPMEYGSLSFPAAGEGGEVQIDRAEDLVDGEFSFPAVGVSGQFHAEECPAGPTLLDDLFDALDYLAISC